MVCHDLMLQQGHRGMVLMHNAKGGRLHKLLISSGILMILGATSLVGCAPEPYGACNMPRSEALDETCNPEGGQQSGQQTTATANCVVDFVFECDSRLCASFEGEKPFCTDRCKDTDGDKIISDAEHAACPDSGFCTEFVPGTGDYYCISDAMARSRNLRQ